MNHFLSFDSRYFNAQGINLLMRAIYVMYNHYDKLAELHIIETLMNK